MRLGRLNKLGIILALTHTVLIIILTATDPAITGRYAEETYSASNALYNLILVLDFLPLLLLRPCLVLVSQIFPTLGFYNFGWYSVFHFLILGGLQYYFIGVLLGKVPKLFHRKRGKESV